MSCDCTGNLGSVGAELKRIARRRRNFLDSILANDRFAVARDNKRASQQQASNKTFEQTREKQREREQRSKKL